MPAGSVCTSYCQGGYEVYPYSSFADVWGSFQIPACSNNAPGFAGIWVELGGDVSGNTTQTGLAAGVVVQNGSAYLAIKSTSIQYGARVTCGDTVTAEVEGSVASVVDDTHTNLSLTARSSQTIYNQDAMCIVQTPSPSQNLYNFGTITFNSECWGYDPEVGWAAFGSYGGSYLWLFDNNNNLLAGDPNAGRGGLGSGPEQIQWYAAS
jgi:hypothetical protein